MLFLFLVSALYQLPPVSFYFSVVGRRLKIHSLCVTLGCLLFLLFPLCPQHIASLFVGRESACCRLEDCSATRNLQISARSPFRCPHAPNMRMLSRFISRQRNVLSHILAFSLILSRVCMLWKLLCVITGSSSPIIVVISESMEPAFQRGDLLFLWNRDESFGVGDVVACWFSGRDLPMVHRVVQKVSLSIATDVNKRCVLACLHVKSAYSMMSPLWFGSLSKCRLTDISVGSAGASSRYLTKGDNNEIDDTILYPAGQHYLDRHDIIGSVRAYIPYVGYARLLFSKLP